VSKKKTQEQFLSEVIEIFPEYDYLSVEYKTTDTKIKVFCKLHGLFYILPSSLLQKKGCKNCGKIKSAMSKTKNTNSFLSKITKIFPEYDYSLVEYESATSKIKIICKLHGMFITTPNAILSLHRCKLCGIISSANTRKKTLEKLKQDIISKHGNIFNLEKINYINDRVKIDIICKVHGLFSSTPSDLLQGCGCPKCKLKNQTLTEIYIKEIFPDAKFEKNIINLEVKNEYNKIIRKKIYPDFIINNNDKKIIIEYNGPQHYKPIKFGSSYDYVKSFNEQILRDAALKKYCKEKNIVFIEIDGRKYTDENIKKYLLNLGLK
jgi:hypothetical protein